MTNALSPHLAHGILPIVDRMDVVDDDLPVDMGWLSLHLIKVDMPSWIIKLYTPKHFPMLHSSILCYYEVINMISNCCGSVCCVYIPVCIILSIHSSFMFLPYSLLRLLVEIIVAHQSEAREMFWKSSNRRRCWWSLFSGWQSDNWLQKGLRFSIVI